LTHAQVCRYCHQDFVPTRRGTQLYCSASCRTTYCRKQKQGTLHRLKRLPGPAHGAPTSFEQLFLAATAGSLTANVVTQTAEYHLVTKDLLAQIAQLQQQLGQQLALNQQQGQLLAQLQHDQQRLLQALGVPLVAAIEGESGQGTLAAPLGPALDPLWTSMPARDELPEFPAMV
jgi:hypothetical protein